MLNVHLVFMLSFVKLLDNQLSVTIAKIKEAKDKKTNMIDKTFKKQPQFYLQYY